MNCPISVVDVGSTRVAQAHNSSIWRGDSRPVPPFRSNRTSASMPPSWNSLIQMRMVESSTKRTLATSSKLIPRSSSRMAFARRETRFSSSPSLVIATRSARSAALRKLRLVFTRRLESIPLIRSNDFRKNEESRYSCRRTFLGLGVAEGVRVEDVRTHPQRFGHLAGDRQGVARHHLDLHAHLGRGRDSGFGVFARRIEQRQYAKK